MEEYFVERVADLLRLQQRPLCGACVAALLGTPHLTTREALQSLAMADAFTYWERCHRCGGQNTVVGVRAA